MIMEAGAEEPYMGTFFVQVYGPEILLITVVESDWLPMKTVSTRSPLTRPFV